MPLLRHLRAVLASAARAEDTQPHLERTASADASSTPVASGQEGSAIQPQDRQEQQQQQPAPQTAAADAPAAETAAPQTAAAEAGPTPGRAAEAAVAEEVTIIFVTCVICL